MDIDTALEKLFGSSARVKIIRLFLSNRKIYSRWMMSPAGRRCLHLPPSGRPFSKEWFYKTKRRDDDEIIKLQRRNRKIKEKINGYFLNALFPFVHALRNLVINARSADKEAMIKEINTIGRIKLVVFPVFSPTAKLASGLASCRRFHKKTKLDKALKNIEAEIGKEIVYAVFKTDDFLCIGWGCMTGSSATSWNTRTKKRLIN